MTEKIENVSVQKLIEHTLSLLVENAKSFERPGLQMHIDSGRTTIVKASSAVAITQAGRSRSENSHCQESTHRSATSDLWCRRVHPR